MSCGGFRDSFYERHLAESSSGGMHAGHCLLPGLGLPSCLGAVCLDVFSGDFVSFSFSVFVNIQLNKNYCLSFFFFGGRIVPASSPWDVTVRAAHSTYEPGKLLLQYLAGRKVRVE